MTENRCGRVARLVKVHSHAGRRATAGVALGVVVVGFGQSRVTESEMTDHMIDAAVPVIGLPPLRPAPPGLPDPAISPPMVAESGDPFTAVRVIDLLARLARGRPIRVADIAERLNATYLDWLFSVSVVADVALQLQANWMADYRNTSGIVVEDGPYGSTITIEESSRVDPWIVRQARREAASCTERLAEFSRRDRLTSGG
jgi:hypothetical protein